MPAARILGARYRIEERLAHGGMGTVWRATDLSLDRPVAVKLMAESLLDDPEAHQRFRKEARAISRLSSRHVVAILDHGVDEGHPFLVMELLDGRDLGSILRREGLLAPDVVLPLLVQLAAGLRAVHAAGIVHRDIKPSNLFVASDAGAEVLKLVDFGVAKLKSPAEDSTKSGIMVGSIRTMAPEQIRAQRDVDHRADLWAVAVVLYVALTSRYPFAGDSESAIAVAACSDPHLPPSMANPALGKGFDGFFRRGLAKSKESRFSTIDELLSAFVVATNAQPNDPSASTVRTQAPASTTSATGFGVADGTHGGSSVERRISPSRKRFVPWLVAAVASALALLGGLVVARSGDERTPVRVARLALPEVPRVPSAEVPAVPPSGTAPVPSAAVSVGAAIVPTVPRTTKAVPGSSARTAPPAGVRFHDSPYDKKKP